MTPAPHLAAALFLSASAPVHARMAPKYERAAMLGAALEHLSTVAGMLGDPIERIEVVGAQVRFVAGKCRVSVDVDDRASSRTPMPGGGDYVGKVGRIACD